MYYGEPSYLRRELVSWQHASRGLRIVFKVIIASMTLVKNWKVKNLKKIEKTTWVCDIVKKRRCTWKYFLCQTAPEHILHLRRQSHLVDANSELKIQVQHYQVVFFREKSAEKIHPN